MPKITYPQVQAIVDHFEALVSACEAYRDFLEQQRPAAYRDRGVGGTFENGRFQADRPTDMPPYGTPEFKEFAVNRQVVRGMGQTQALLDLLEGAGYDRVRAVVDGLGTLESAFRGEWV